MADLELLHHYRGGARDGGRDERRYLTVRFTLNADSSPDGVIVATAEQLPGCVSQGKTLIEALANIGEAITAWSQVKIRFDGNHPAPDPQPPALQWAKLYAPDRPDMIGIREIGDGWGEALIHNEAMGYPFHTAILPPEERAMLMQQTNEQLAQFKAKLNETTY